MHAAIRDPDPVMYVNAGRLKGQTQDVADEPFEVPIGEAAVRSEGSDLTIIGYGPVMPYIAGAVESLTSEGASIEVVDLRTLFPLDRETILASAQKTGRVLSVEPGKFTFGVGAEVLATVLEGAPGAIGRRIAYPDAPPPAAPEMFAWMQVTEQRILDAARTVLEA
jgi:pyruvate dehydrogenase E1 component beta subunit